MAWRSTMRREDDRYLFLEALLSARERLHISWVGAQHPRQLRPSAPVLVGAGDHPPQAGGVRAVAAARR